MTVVFGIVPLLVGLAFGFYLGRKWEQRQQEIAKRTTSKQHNSSALVGYVSYFLTIIMGLRSLVMTISNLAIFVFTARWLPSNEES